jgi:hypothetical protein
MDQLGKTSTALALSNSYFFLPFAGAAPPNSSAKQFGHPFLELTLYFFLQS